MRALVTGGAGFIGSTVSRKLLERGWEVSIVDNLSGGRMENVPKGAKFHWAELTQADYHFQLPSGPFDAIFHLASHVGQLPSYERPVYDLETNAAATLKLLQWAKTQNCKKFIFASSMNVYGEPDSFPVTEESAVKPGSFYAIGKTASEHYCRIFQTMGIDTTILRLFNVYGPMQNMENLKQGMVSIYLYFLAKNLPIYVRGSLDRTRDFVFVDDVAEAFIACVDEKAAGKTYNVATGRKTSVKELLALATKIWGKDPLEYPISSGDPTPFDQFHAWGSAEMLTRELGWTPKVSLEEGLEKMIGWIKGSGFS